jgi:sugar transferase/CoA-binding protein
VGASARLRRRWFTTIGPVVTVADVGAVLLAGLVVGVAGDGRSLGPVVAAALVAGLLAWAADLHRPRLVLSIVEDLPGLLVAAAAATAVLLLTDHASATFGILALATLVLAHTVVYGTTHVLRRTGRLRRRVLVVGTGPTARRLTRTLLVRPEYGLTPVGMVGTGDGDPLGQARGLPLPLLGPVQLLPGLMSEAGVGTVLFALPDPAGDRETVAIEDCLATSADVYAVPANFPPSQAHARHPRELVGGVSLVHVYRRPVWTPVRAGKRLTEVLVSLVALAAVLPLAALVAVPVLVETGGVLVAHPQGDEGGTPRTAPRFRTRRARSLGRPGTTWSVAISGRSGPIGRGLRRTGLDRLPELVQVLLRRLVHPRVAGSGALGSARAPRPHQPQVDARQLLA